MKPKIRTWFLVGLLFWACDISGAAPKESQRYRKLVVVASDILSVSTEQLLAEPSDPVRCFTWADVHEKGVKALELRVVDFRKRGGPTQNVAASIVVNSDNIILALRSEEQLEILGYDVVFFYDKDQRLTRVTSAYVTSAIERPKLTGPVR